MEKKKRLTVDVPADVRRELRKRAAEQDTTVSDLLRRKIDEIVKETKQTKKD